MAHRDQAGSAIALWFCNNKSLVLGSWYNRGNVEKYFKYKYSNFNYPIGSLTEYFKFDQQEMAMVVRCDLEQMSPKTLSPVEQVIIENESSPIEQLLCSQLNHQQ